MNYYNEHDTKAAAWLRALIAAGEIPPGVVDERSIIEIKATELTEYVQCHFFAGIGGWSLALKLSGWPVTRKVWTGSCPCQPFSVAGKGMGESDERHLWPDFRNLIGKCNPPVVFGEQVASADGRKWLAGVSADMETLAYRFAAADLCAAGVGAPHRRQRLFWVADSSLHRCSSRRPSQSGQEGRNALSEHRGQPGGLAHAGYEAGCSEHGDALQERDSGTGKPSERSGGMVLASESGLEGHARNGDNRSEPRRHDQKQNRSTPSAGSIGAWERFTILPFRDGKARRVEAGTFPLAHGISGRVGLLRGYGNAIVPQVASEFIGAWLDTSNEKGQR